MAINIYLPKILKEEMFDLLTRRYDASYDEIKQDDRHQKFLIYRDSINLIQNYDEWLLRIKQDVRSAEIIFKKLNEIQRNQFLGEIRTLQYSSDLLPDWQGVEIFACTKFMQYMLASEVDGKWGGQKNVVALFNETFELNKFCTNSAMSQESVLDEDLAKRYCEISEILKAKIKTDEEVKETFSFSDEEEDYFQYFNRTLEQCGQVYVMCLDIKLYVPLQESSNSYDNVFKVLKDKINSVHCLLGQIENLQSYLLRLEPMQEIGINLHCVLMINCKVSNFSEDGVIAQLDKKLKSMLGFSSVNCDIKNWGNILRKYRDPKAVGLIKKNNETSRYSCWYWVYSYFFSVDQVIGLNLETAETTHIVKILKTDSLSFSKNTSQKILEPLVKEQISFGKMQDSLKIKSIIDPKHLPQIAQGYLAKVALMDLPNFLSAISHNDRKTYKSLFYSIELFCETLKTVTPKLFNFVGIASISKKHRSPKFYSDNLTRLGLIWFDLLVQLNSEINLRHYLISHDLESDNTNIFCGLFQSYKEQILMIHEKPITAETIQEYENILTFLKSNLSGYRYKSHIKYLDKTFEKLRDYSGFLLEEDVLVHRVYIQFSSMGMGELSKKERSAILTEFLRVGRSTQPLRWLRGYILRWDEKPFKVGKHKTLYADLTLVFNYDPKLQQLNIQEELTNFLERFVQKYYQKDYDCYSSLDRVDVSAGKITHTIEHRQIFDGIRELSASSLKIETTDKLTRKAFTESYLPYICYKSLFSSLSEWSIKEKRLTTGQKPKSKHRTVMKKKDE